jgi:hypothetical protein
MAVAALRDALTAMDAATIDALYFASRTPPYAEKQSATTIGWAANLRTDIFTVDCTDSLRAGTNALKLAMDATKAASAKRVAVGAADNRLAQPRSSFERTFGDGAATLVVGVEKLRDNPYTGLAVGTGNLTSSVDPAVPPPVQFALAATRYAHQYDLPVEELKRILAKIAVKNHANGAKNPKAHFRREIAIDLAEVHDCFTITELLIYEDLGFAPRGRARERVDAGTVELNGELAVNPDGGLKCFGHPIGGSGLRMIYEVYKQLQGKAGSRQRKNPTLGLTHNIGGRPGSFTCSVAIFGK